MTTFCYHPEKEETIYIVLPGTDGLKIKGILRGSLDRQLAILVHGRPGNGDDTRMYLFARYLYEQGISSLRLFLYDDQKGTRDLLDISTVDTHAADIDIVVQYLRAQGVVSVVAIGHSYGGLTILKSHAELEGAVLWDASHGLVWQERAKKVSTINYRQYDENVVMDKRGRGYVISKAMSEADQELGDTSRLAHATGCPIFVITAGTGMLVPYGKMYYDAAREPKKYLNIAQATHLFMDSDEVLLELFEQTAKWIKETVNKND